GRHAAFAADAVAEGDIGEVAGVVVGPVVVDAAETLGGAARLHAHQRAAMRAAVLPRVQLSVRVARDDHRHVADEGGDEALRPGQLGLEAEVVPGVAAPDLRLLFAIQILVLVDPVRDACRAFRRPGPLEHRLIIITAHMRTLLFLLGVLFLVEAPAQEWPQKTVRIIVPFPAGGSADLLPRYVGEKLSQQWGQPVIVDNRPGAAGNIGATAAYQADPDGYTLLS